MNIRTLSLVLGVMSCPGAWALAGPAPSINAIWPRAHLGTMCVEIDGSGLRGATQVTIGGVPARFKMEHGSLYAKVDTEEVSGPVEVVTPDGKAVSERWVEGPPFFGVEGLD